MLLFALVAVVACTALLSFAFSSNSDSPRYDYPDSYNHDDYGDDEQRRKKGEQEMDMKRKKSSEK